MNLANATVLGYDRTNKFFDSDFRFGADTSYTINGYLLDLQNTIGVSGVAEASEFFRTGLQDYQDIEINGDNFGKGRVTSFNVEESNWVRYTTYSLSIEGFESGNLHNLSGDYYNGLNTLTGKIQASHLLEDFSETFDFNRSDDSYSYSHSVNIKYGSGDNILISPIDRAKTLATYILTGSNPSFGFIDNQTSGLYTGNYREYFDESYDAINNTVNITKRFDSLNPSGDYSIALKNSFDVGEDGITNITENANVKAHSEPKTTSLKDAISTELAKAYARCAEIDDHYNNAPVSQKIHSSPSSLSQTINNFLGEGGYVVTFTNDPAFNNTYRWTYTHQIDKNGAFFVVSENGDIIGMGSKSLTKFNNAKEGYETVKGGIDSRVDAFYQDSVTNPQNLTLVSQNENKSEFNGTIRYARDFTDDPSYSENGVKKMEITVEDTIPVDLKNTFEIIGYKELVQSVNTTTHGLRSLNIKLDGLRESSLDGLLTIAEEKANNYIPNGNDIYISDANYNFNEQTKSAEVSVSWNFNRASREVETV